MTPAPTHTSLVGLLLKKYRNLFFFIAFVLPALSLQAQTKEEKIYVQIENDAVPPFSIDYTGLVITQESHCTAPFNGAIQFPISGGSGSYTLHWTGPSGYTKTETVSAGTYLLSALQNGSYDVVIEDGGGCKVNESFSVPLDNFTCYTGPGCSLGIGSSFSNSAHGCGGSLGEIHFVAYGANISPNFSYTVSGPNTYSHSGTGTDTDLDGQIAIDLYNLQKGTYHVTVTFNNSCPTSSGTQTFDVEVKPWHFTDGAYVSGEVSNCLNGNGAIFIGTLADVSTNMSYELSGPSGTQTLSPTTQTVNSLVVGTYTLTITDNDNGCSQTETFEVEMSSSPSLTINLDESITNTHCEAPYTGKIAVSASGGSGSYEYNWTDGSGNPVSSSPTITDVNGDYYSVSVRDFTSGCSVSRTLFIDTENLLEYYTDINGGFPTANTNCSAPYNGSVNITVTSGSPGPFEYTFYPALNLHSSVDEDNTLLPVTTPFTQSTTTGLAPGGYYIEVKDLTTGCTGFFRDPDFGPIAVGIPDASTPSLNVTIDNLINNTICGTPGDGAAAVTVTSGTTYTTTWKNLNDLTTYSAEDPTTLSPGLYELSVSVLCSGAPNQAPVLSSSTSTINTNSNTSTFINNTIGVTDVDDVNMEGATISLGTGFISAEDQLIFTNQNGITGNYSSASGILTLTGSATEANYQTALRSVRYRSIAIPTFQPRTILFAVTDGTVGSNSVNTTVTINNQPPTVAGSGSPVTFIPSSGPVVISSSLTVSDTDNANLQSAEVRITSGTFVSSEDLLLFTNQNGITGSYNFGSGVLSLSGFTSVANYQIALQSVQYNNTQASPNTQNRVITFVVNDGTNGSNVATQTVLLGANQLPIVTTSTGTSSFLASAGSIVIDNTVTVTDSDDTNLESATIKISTASFVAGQDLLIFTTQNGITGNYNATSGSLTLTGTSSVANYQTAIRSVQYNNSQASPNTQNRIIEFQVNDGTGNSALVTKTVSITLPNQPPVVITTTGNTTFLASSGGITIDAGVTITDTDDTNLEGATVQISAASFVTGQDLLLFSNQNGISGNYNATSGLLSLAGTSSLANYQTALRSVQYNNSQASPNTLNRIIEFQVNDGDDNSSIVTKTILVTIPNQPPVVSTSTGNTSFLSSSGGAIIDTGITITDANDLILQSATIRISAASFVADQDIILFSNQNGITGSYGASTGILSLAGAASTANYQTALQSIQYNNTDVLPEIQNRVIEFVVNDGTDNSAVATKTIIVSLNQSPVVTTSTGNTTFLSSSGGVIIDPSIITTDTDNTQLQNASVRITAATLIASQDLLLFTNQNGIFGNYFPSTGELMLTGEASLANYQQALRSVQYNNSATTPNMQIRLIEFRVNDGNTSSSAASKSVQLQLFNKPPVITSTPVTTQIESIVSINLMTLISDPDNNIDLTTLKITKQPVSGAPASISSTFELNVDYSGSRFAGTDNLSIEVCDQLAECAQHELFITVEGDIAIYNGFSPNGDGANPFFRIQNIETLEPKNNVSIFNRWGDNVFEIANYDNNSNKFIGENKNGNALPSGTYFYKIEFASGRKPITGYLTLKR